MNFASDNVYGVHQDIMDAIVAANAGTTPSYSADEVTAQVERRFRAIFEHDVAVFLLATGTAANALALSTMTPAYGAIFAHSHAHINVDECGAPEFYTSGAKIIGLPGVGGKITPQMLKQSLNEFVRQEHDPKPAAISITQSSELGTVYSLEEVAAFGDQAKRQQLRLHMDGARFANALVSLNTTPAELTWKSGVDALSFGATKNGAMGVEAVVFFDQSLAKDFSHRRMRAGHLLSKSRFLAAQMLAYLSDDLWLNNARIANDHATRLARSLSTLDDVRLAAPVEANEVFAIIPDTLNKKLLAAGADYHPWIASPTDIDPIAENEVMIRLVTSFATPPSYIDQFIEAIRS